MQIKRFEAKEMREALKQVKEAMGPEAILLSVRKIAAPSGHSRESVIEVMAAIDREAGATAAPILGTRRSGISTTFPDSASPKSASTAPPP